MGETLTIDHIKEFEGNTFYGFKRIWNIMTHITAPSNPKLVVRK